VRRLLTEVIPFVTMAQELPVPRTTRYQSLDHWRGFACLVVLINHSVWTGPDSGTWSEAERVFTSLASRLWLGVPMFFVISGYCIAATVDSHRRRAKRSLYSYLTRRVRRIFPPYWVVLAATVVVVALVDTLIAGRPLTSDTSGLFLRPWWYSSWQWIGNITLTEQWRMNVIGGQKAWFLGHAWTLSYEEQFYLVAALLLWAMPRRFFAGAAAVSAVVGAVAVAGPQWSWPIEGFFFDGSWLQFYLGVVVYFAINYAGRAVQWFLAAAFAAVALSVLLLSNAISSDVKTVSQAFTVALLFAFILIPLHRFDQTIATLKVMEPFRYAGLMCYSLYLVHLPINKLLHAALRSIDAPSTPWLTVPICAAVSLPIAWLFHLSVERRFMVSQSPARLPNARASTAVA
jgi:peptidoglycan/LPS O-acetylase OafA/YrhL